MLVRNVSSRRSSVSSSIDAACSWNAALLTSTSSRPKAASVFFTTCAAKCGLLTSPATRRQRRPSASTRRWVSSRIVVLVEIGDRDVGALAREQHGHRPADARIAAGDDRAEAGELAASVVVGRAEPRRQPSWLRGRAWPGAGPAACRAAVVRRPGRRPSSSRFCRPLRNGRAGPGCSESGVACARSRSRRRLP